MYKLILNITLNVENENEIAHIMAHVLESVGALHQECFVANTESSETVCEWRSEEIVETP